MRAFNHSQFNIMSLFTVSATQWAPFHFMRHYKTIIISIVISHPVGVTVPHCTLVTYYPLCLKTDIGTSELLLPYYQGLGKTLLEVDTNKDKEHKQSSGSNSPE